MNYVGYFFYLFVYRSKLIFSVILHDLFLLKYTFCFRMICFCYNIHFAFACQLLHFSCSKPFLIFLNLLPFPFFLKLIKALIENAFRVCVNWEYTKDRRCGWTQFSRQMSHLGLPASCHNFSKWCPMWTFLKEISGFSVFVVGICGFLLVYSNFYVLCCMYFIYCICRYFTLRKVELSGYFF